MIFNMAGGGAPLNFKVVGGTSQPANPKENTIWVNTATEIENWIFSTFDPNMLDFDAWASSIAVYNSTKSYANGVFSITAGSNGDGYTSFSASTTVARLPVTPGKTYVLSWTHTGSDGRVCIFPNGITTGYEQVLASTTNHLEYTATDGVEFITFRVGVSVANTTASYSNITFCEKGQEVRPGTVWIRTDKNSALAFNALKENALEVYPVLASQYISGAFVQKDILLYQDGAWESGILVLYDNGDQCLTVSGGWTGYAVYNGSADPSGETSMTIVGSNNGYQWGGLMNNTPVDFTSFTKLCFDVTVNSLTNVRCTCGYSTKGVTGSGNEIIMNTVGSVTLPGSVGRTTKYLDISTVTGAQYVAIQSGDYVSIHKVWLE